MWADPKDPRRMMIGSDGGVSISTTRGQQWSRTRLPIGQMYHVATDNRIPYWVYGQMQDDGSMRGPSVVAGGGGISPAQWTSTAGCETGWATPDPVDPEHRLGRLLRRRRRALRRADRDGPHREPVAGEDDGRERRADQAADELDVPDRDLAARPQHRLRRQPVRPRDVRRRRALEGDQPRPDHKRQDA